jgi:hypothetical protein
MHRRKIIVASALAIIYSLNPAVAADQKPLELFGVILKGASRDQLRQAFKANGLRVKDEMDFVWTDTYDARNVLDGASGFVAGYVLATGKFSYAQYTFPSFMDSEQVRKVINMVAIKYGKPTSQIGRYDLGEVQAKWEMGQDMLIEVKRGWPDTTTSLSFIDKSTNKQMSNEMFAVQKESERKNVKAQSKAF